MAPHVMDVIGSTHYLQYSSPSVYTESNHGEMRQNLDWGTPLGFPGGSEGKEPASSAEDWGSSPRSGKTPGEGNGYPLWYSWLENSMDREPGGLQSMGLQSLTWLND